MASPAASAKWARSGKKRVMNMREVKSIVEGLKVIYFNKVRAPHLHCIASPVPSLCLASSLF